VHASAPRYWLMEVHITTKKSVAQVGTDQIEGEGGRQRPPLTRLGTPELKQQMLPKAS